MDSTQNRTNFTREDPFVSFLVNKNTSAHGSICSISALKNIKKRKVVPKVVQIAEKKEIIYQKFLRTIRSKIVGAILVGSLAWGKTHVTPKSDIDAVIVCEREKLRGLINTKYLKETHDAKSINLASENADYFTSKFMIDDTKLSIDIMSLDFFERICNLDLTKCNKSEQSSKFGKVPQNNAYPIFSFTRKMKIVKKTNKNYLYGWIIRLPLFFIKDGRYYYGIPTIKLLTYQITVDKEGSMKRNLDVLFHNIVCRMVFEYPEKLDPFYNGNVKIENLFYNLPKIPRDYLSKIKAKEEKLLREIRAKNV